MLIEKMEFYPLKTNNQYQSFSLFSQFTNKTFPYLQKANVILEVSHTFEFVRQHMCFLGLKRKHQLENVSKKNLNIFGEISALTKFSVS